MLKARCRGDLQRRCYWLLEADEDIVLVHYLSAGQMTGGPRSKGPGARAAASRSSTEEPEASDTTHTTSSDGSAGQRQALESPFLAKARIANAQSQAGLIAGTGHPDAASSPPPPQVGPSLRPRNRDGTAVQQAPPQLQSPLSGRPAAIAAAATRNLGYSSSLSKVLPAADAVAAHCSAARWLDGVRAAGDLDKMVHSCCRRAPC
jgi:CG-1 domain